MVCVRFYVVSGGGMLVGYFVFVFCFFFKQKTAYEMRISDWSSDVCSSDLLHRWSAGVAGELRFQTAGARRHQGCPTGGAGSPVRGMECYSWQLLNRSSIRPKSA